MPAPTGDIVASGLMLAEQALHVRIEAAFDFGFDVRGKVVDDVLHDRLRSRAQFVVQMHQQGVGGFFGGGRCLDDGRCSTGAAAAGLAPTVSNSRGICTSSADQYRSAAAVAGCHHPATGESTRDRRAGVQTVFGGFEVSIVCSESL
jgi:hypothetical protein